MTNTCCQRKKAHCRMAWLIHAKYPAYKVSLLRSRKPLFLIGWLYLYHESMLAATKELFIIACIRFSAACDGICDVIIIIARTATGFPYHNFSLSISVVGRRCIRHICFKRTNISLCLLSRGHQCMSRWEKRNRSFVIVFGIYEKAGERGQHETKSIQCVFCVSFGLSERL